MTIVEAQRRREPSVDSPLLDLLICPLSGQGLRREKGHLVSLDGHHRYALSPEDVPLFAAEALSDDARVQQAHYDRLAEDYAANLAYPHTREYMAYLDRVLLEAISSPELGTVAEICCGHGEAFSLVGPQVQFGVGVDVSLAMLREARRQHADSRFAFVQGDATRLPLAASVFDTVFMLGGIHHVNDRRALFSEVARILKPGGRFYFREPVSDFLPWRALRAIVYRLASGLDHRTERPLLHHETVPVLEEAGLRCDYWRTYGFLGFCIFMNSDVLVFNRAFRHMPGIRAVTRGAVRVDDWTTSLPGMTRSGLQVVGSAVKNGA